MAYPACSKRSDRLFRTGAMACLLAAPWVQLSVSAGNGWPHNALRHRWLIMPISCHFRDCKTLLVTSLTHVSGAGYSKCPDHFKDHYIFSNRPYLLTFTARCYAQAQPMPSCSICPSVRPSRSCTCIVWKRPIVSSNLKRFTPSDSHTVVVFSY